ncbi:MAG TPA: HEPN domain-containing protein [Candidatus Methylomirabilis sp.]|nr:HEPN domain-containing protein [Candidatus Methylomirabilis sp.]
MPPEESQYPRDWLRIAEKDWRRVDLALRDEDAEEAGFWLQQATEKYLKAYLLSKGWVLRKVHDLEVLVNEASLHRPDFRRYGAACRKITGFYLSERYPFVDELFLTSEEVTDARGDVAGLIEAIRQEFQQ